jgi:hypothetical protein
VVKKTGHNGIFPDVDEDRVVWKFRFEYQFNRSEPPWWQRIDEVAPRSAPVINTADHNQEWQLTPHGPTMSYQSAEDVKRIDDLSTNAETAGKLREQLYKCQTCNGISSVPYLHGGLCLNETCKEWDRWIRGISKSF